MILVEWKGDDERPYRLSFHPHFTLVHVPEESRDRLVREIAAAFEGPLAKLGATPDEPANVIGQADLEWLFDGDPARDNIEVAEPDFSPAEIEHRRLVAQDEFASAEARFERTVSEVRAENLELMAQDETSASAQVVRLRKILNWRIESLETAIARPLPSVSEVQDLLEEAKRDELWPLHRTWEENYALVEEALSGRQTQEARPRPPEWLIEQSQRELALAESALEVFAAQEGAHTPSFLEREARRRYGEALEVWEELQPYLDVETTNAPASITPILDSLEELSGRRAYGADEALAIISQCLFDMHKAFVVSDRIRIALEQAGKFLSPSADYFAEAREWVANRQAELTQREEKQTELAAFQSDLAGLAAMEVELQSSPEHNVDEHPRVVAARKELHSAKTAYEAELSATDKAGADMIRSRYQQPATEHALSMPSQRLAKMIAEFQGAIDEEIPLIVNAAFDELTAAQRNDLLVTLKEAAPVQQIIYFTQNEEVMAWAEGQNSSMVSLCTVAA